MTWLAGADAGWTIEWLGPDEDPTLYPGFGPSGAATFALDLENGYTVTLRWPTSIVKARAGNEERSARNDRPLESYAGEAILLGDTPRLTRATLARHAASGQPFMFGLPHEALSVRADAIGTVVYVHSTALIDWKNPGQRVLVMRENDDGEMEYVAGVIQSTTADSITLDVSPGDVGAYGAVIMPARPVLLEPQQGFPRYPVAAERWSLSGRAAILDFAMEYASLALGPVTDSAGLANAVIRARGPFTKPIVLWLDEDDSFPDGKLTEITSDPLQIVVRFRFKPGATTIQQFVDAIDSATYVLIDGATDLTSKLVAGDAALAQLTGGSLAGPYGTGATLTEYESMPVWDREIVSRDTIEDGIHAMTEIIDHGGLPYSVGTADQPDFYRAVVHQSADRSEWQWLKLFMSTVRGPEGSFWLATWRDDLVYVSHAGADVTIDLEASDFHAWYPSLRRHVQVRQTDGTITYAEITSVAGPVITLSESLSASSIEMISWLELCRFEGESFQIPFDEHGFVFSATARVVVGDNKKEQAVELFKIERSDGVTYYHTSGVRDVEYDGQRWTAIAMDRSEVAIVMPGEDEDMTLTLPIDHELCRRWVQMMTPPRSVAVTVWRQTSEGTDQIWYGEITDMGAERSVAKFRVPSSAGEWMLRQVPSVSVGRTCGVMLYSTPCGIAETGSHNNLAFRVSTTVIAVNGREVRVDLGSTSRNGDWAVHGIVRHVATGEAQTVDAQDDLSPGVSSVAVLTMRAPIPGMKVGDSVQILAGCDWTLKTCHEKFGNRQNFRGMPELDEANPFTPGSRVL